MLARSSSALLLAAAAAVGSPAFAQSAPAALVSIEADGTQFRVTLDDGRVLHSAELVGATFTIKQFGAAHRVRIDAVETDPGDPAHDMPPAPQVFLHTLSVETQNGAWENICRPGPDGRRQAFPIAGRTQAGGIIQPAEAGAFEITCTGGAQGKCVRFGYHPWEAAPDGSNGYDLYNTCVRMVRADYSGDGKGTTRNGQLIDIYDDFGIQRIDGETAAEFEAGWSLHGAVCVRHVRVKDNASLAELEAVPSLHGRTGAICTEEFAREHGAVIFNRSRN